MVLTTTHDCKVLALFIIHSRGEGMLQKFFIDSIGHFLVHRLVDLSIRQKIVFTNW